MKMPLLRSETGVFPSWWAPRCARRVPDFGYGLRKNCWGSWTNGSQLPKTPPPRQTRRWGLRDEVSSSGAGFQSHPYHLHDRGWCTQRTARQWRPGQRTGAAAQRSWWHLGGVGWNRRLAAHPQDSWEGEREQSLPVL